MGSFGFSGDRGGTFVACVRSVLLFPAIGCGHSPCGEVTPIQRLPTTRAASTLPNRSLGARLDRGPNRLATTRSSPLLERGCAHPPGRCRVSVGRTPKLSRRPPLIGATASGISHWWTSVCVRGRASLGVRFGDTPRS